MIYANDIDADAAHWLSCLPFGFEEVDTRSIKEVRARDVIGFKQCHFFAGIGGWPLALAMAGWPIDREVWTGSCPCQPFSAAGKRKGTKDERHLWPEFRRLIDECRPATIFGEQVASKDGRDWLAVVRTDLEAMGYAVGAADLCAAGVGAPHIRQRLFWVANGDMHGRNQRRAGVTSKKHDGAVGDCASSGLANCDREGLAERQKQSPRKELTTTERSGDAVGVGNTHSEGPHASPLRGVYPAKEISRARDGQFERSGWAGVEYIPCRDGKARPTKPGVRVLAHGIPGRVAQLRGLGNAIVPQVSAEFIAAYLEAEADVTSAGKGGES